MRGTLSLAEGEGRGEGDPAAAIMDERSSLVGDARIEDAVGQIHRNPDRKSVV